MYKRKYKTSLLVILVLFAFSIISSFILIEKFFLENEFKKQVLKSSLLNIQTQEQFMYRLIEDTKNTLFYLKDLEIFEKAINQNSFDILENTFLTIAQSNRYFMQVRYIDKDGLEKIRVDRKTDTSELFLIQKDELQDKSKRDYFIDSKKQKTIFISSLNLNIENGKIQRPYNPTLRVILPIFKDKSFFGEIVVNLSVDFLLDSEIFDISIFHIKNGEIVTLDESYNSDLKKEIADNSMEIIKNKYFINGESISYKITKSLRDDILLYYKFKELYLAKLHSDEVKTRVLIFFVVIVFTSLITLYIFYMVNKIFKRHTELEKLNKELAFSNQELKGANELISKGIDPYLIISNLKTSMIITGKLEDDTPIIYVNDGFCNLYGYSKDEVIGKNPRFLNRNDREQKHLEPLRKAIKDKDAVTTIIRNYTKSGELKYIELSISPVFEKNSNDIKYFLGVHKDVTREQKLLNDIKQLF